MQKQYREKYGKKEWYSEYYQQPLFQIFCETKLNSQVSVKRIINIFPKEFLTLRGVNKIVGNKL